MKMDRGVKYLFLPFLLIMLASIIALPSVAFAGFKPDYPIDKSSRFQTLSYPLNPQDSAVTRALDYLRQTQQQSVRLDGRIAGFNVSAWAVMAIAAAGEDPHAWVSGGKSVVDYLKEKAPVAVSPDKATDYERMILAIVASGENPRDFGGIDFVDDLLSFYDGTQIGGASLLNDDSWGILALVSTGAGPEIVQKTKQFLINNRNADGGWGLGVGLESDADNTAAVVSALIAAGELTGSQIIISALDFLKTQQEDNGGFVSVDGGANAGSTTWAISAIVAAGQSPLAPDWTRNGNNPVSFLLSLQSASGAFKQTPSQMINPEWMTAYAIPSLLGKPYPRDTTSPEVSGISPSDGSTIGNTGVTINAGYSDSTAGIDQSTVKIFLDGAEVTAGASVTSSASSYNATNLSAGTHSVMLTVNDNCGNEAREEWSFQVQQQSPPQSGTVSGSLPLATPETLAAAVSPPPGTYSVSGLVNSSGFFSQDFSAVSKDKKCALEIKQDTTGLTNKKEALQQITIVEMKEPPLSPADNPAIGTVFDLGPDDTTFDPPVSLTLTYEESAIPDGIEEEALVISTYDPANDRWVELESTVDSGKNTVTARVGHFCAFAVTARTAPAVVASDLSVSPTQVFMKENVEISVLVTNSSSKPVCHEVTLVMDGAAVKSREMTLEAGEKATVTFAVTGYLEGKHTVEIEGLHGIFEVKPEPSPPVVTAETPPAEAPAEKDSSPVSSSLDTEEDTAKVSLPPVPEPSFTPVAEGSSDMGVITGVIVAVILGGIIGFLLLRRRMHV